MDIIHIIKLDFNNLLLIEETAKLKKSKSSDRNYSK